jgi:hypothetical protein
MAFIDFDTGSAVFISGGGQSPTINSAYLVFANTGLIYCDWSKYIPESLRDQTTKTLRITVGSPTTNGNVYLPYSLFTVDSLGNMNMTTDFLTIEVQNTTNFFSGDINVSALIDASIHYAILTLQRNAPLYPLLDTLAGDMYFVNAKIV